MAFSSAILQANSAKFFVCKPLKSTQNLLNYFYKQNAKPCPLLRAVFAKNGVASLKMLNFKAFK